MPLEQHGAMIVDGHEVADTMQCCHCGNHFVRVPGSGRIRGFCRNCMAVTCGDPACHACKPFEKWLKEVERAAAMAIPG